MKNNILTLSSVILDLSERVKKLEKNPTTVYRDRELTPAQIQLERDYDYMQKAVRKQRRGWAAEERVRENNRLDEDLSRLGDIINQNS